MSGFIIVCKEVLRIEKTAGETIECHSCKIVLLPDKTKDGINSILPIVSLWSISQQPLRIKNDHYSSKLQYHCMNYLID